MNNELRGTSKPLKQYNVTDNREKMASDVLKDLIDRIKIPDNTTTAQPYNQFDTKPDQTTEDDDFYGYVPKQAILNKPYNTQPIKKQIEVTPQHSTPQIEDVDIPEPYIPEYTRKSFPQEDTEIENNQDIPERANNEFDLDIMAEPELLNEVQLKAKLSNLGSNWTSQNSNAQTYQSEHSMHGKNESTEYNSPLEATNIIKGILNSSQELNQYHTDYPLLEREDSSVPQKLSDNMVRNKRSRNSVPSLSNTPTLKRQKIAAPKPKILKLTPTNTASTPKSTIPKNIETTTKTTKILDTSVDQPLKKSLDRDTITPNKIKAVKPIENPQIDTIKPIKKSIEKVQTTLKKSIEANEVTNLRKSTEKTTPQTLKKSDNTSPNNLKKSNPLVKSPITNTAQNKPKTPGITKIQNTQTKSKALNGKPKEIPKDSDHPNVEFIQNAKFPREIRQRFVDVLYKEYLLLFPPEKKSQAAVASLVLELELYKQCATLPAYRSQMMQKLSILKKRIKEKEAASV